MIVLLQKHTVCCCNQLFIDTPEINSSAQNRTKNIHTRQERGASVIHNNIDLCLFPGLVALVVDCDWNVGLVASFSGRTGGRVVTKRFSQTTIIFTGSTETCNYRP